MSKENKKWNKYARAVRRRLNLPRGIKKRVMNDFFSSIQSRRESGQTDEEILTELGTPKAFAANLNEQMKEFAYRKSPWRWLCLGLMVLSGGFLLMEPILNLLLGIAFGGAFYVSTVGERGSVGVIGGADGPTAIFVTHSGPDYDVIIIGILLILSALGFYFLGHMKNKQGSDQS